MRVPRFQIRSLMIAVAVAGVLFAAEVTRRRLLTLTSTYSTKAIGCQHRALMALRAGELEARQGNQIEAQSLRRIADHYVALVTKYERAARYPWLPVAPDPPEPK